jgi:outer membrane protein insertion porin family
VRFAGNDFFSDETLDLRIRTQPNRRFLGIPGFTWWLWLYRLGASGSVGDRLGQVLMSSGEPPAYLDSTVISADLERLQLFYLQEGFREAKVGVAVDTTDGGKQAEVTFQLMPGAPTYVRRVSYEGLEQLSQAQQVRLARASLLRPQQVDPEAPLSFAVRTQRYSEPTLHEERRRILAFLRDEGFAAVTRDSIRAVILPVRADSFDVTFRIRTGLRYRFGDVHVALGGPEDTERLRTDTLALAASADTVAGGDLSVEMRYESKLKVGLLTRSLPFRPGDWYSQSRLLATKRRLEATGVFTFTDIVPQGADSSGVGEVPRLPHRIELRTRPRHQVRVESFMLLRTGAYSSSLSSFDNELGAGLGISYQNANIFGGGETFRVQMTGSIAANIESLRDITSVQTELTTSLTYPYLIAPFRRLERWLNLYDARTQLSLTLLTASSDNLRLVIRGRGTARFRLEMQHRPNLTSFVDVLDLSLSNPDTLDGFNDRFLSQIIGPDTDPVQRAQILEDYTQPQVNTALRYTLRSARVNPLLRDRGYSYEGSFEIGNNLPYLLDRLVFTPDALEGSLPGLPFFGGDRSDNRLLYRQYIRLLGDLRQYRTLGPSAVLAWKFIAGAAYPTGQADVIPFERRFFSGGGSSVRGWRARALGPGAVAQDSLSGDGGGTNLLGGEIKLEGSLELRTTLLQNVFGADWVLALFTDAGNVWFGPRNPGYGEPSHTGEAEGSDGHFRFGSFYKELGVGSGFGLRLAWDYLILRLDVAYRVYDPARSSEGILPDALSNPQLHFAIGQAF